MKRFLIPLLFAAPAAAQDASLCESNASTLESLSTQISALSCRYNTPENAEAEAAVAELENTLAASSTAIFSSQSDLNAVSDQLVKLDAKIASLLADSNVSTDESILIFGVATYESIKALQSEREALAQQSLDLQAELEMLQTAHAELVLNLQTAQSNLAAAQAATAIASEAETTLRNALNQGNFVATNICGAEPVEVPEGC